MIKITNKAEALTYLDILMCDFAALQAGEWEPDHDSCEASMELLQTVINFMEEMK